jgi:hypothetical protein
VVPYTLVLCKTRSSHNVLCSRVLFVQRALWSTPWLTITANSTFDANSQARVIANAPLVHTARRGSWQADVDAPLADVRTFAGEEGCLECAIQLRALDSEKGLALLRDPEATTSQIADVFLHLGLRRWHRGLSNADRRGWLKRYEIDAPNFICPEPILLGLPSALEGEHHEYIIALGVTDKRDIMAAYIDHHGDVANGIVNVSVAQDGSEEPEGVDCYVALRLPEHGGYEDHPWLHKPRGAFVGPGWQPAPGNTCTARQARGRC